MTISKRYIDVEIDGAPVKFHKMTPYDRAEIAESMQKRMRPQLEANLAAAKATPEQLMAELERFDAEFPFRPIMRIHIVTAAGQLDVFRRALKADHSPEKVEEILKKLTLDEDEAEKLAMELCGLKPLPVPQEQPPKEGEDNSAYGEDGPKPNPQEPAEESYSTPAK